MGDLVILLEKIQSLAKSKRFTVVVIVLLIIQGIVSNLSFSFSYKHEETFTEESSASGIHSEKRITNLKVLNIELDVDSESN